MPTRPELLAAAGRTIPDLVRPGLDVLLVGINPGLWSGLTGRHFGNPGNRLWPVLHGAGFTPRRIGPADAEELLALGIGITNLVARTTATAAELADEEVRAGALALEAKVATLRPRVVAFLGLTTYRIATGEKGAVVGEQPGRLAGARVWLLPNTSGLNAHYQIPDLIALFAAMRSALG